MCPHVAEEVVEHLAQPNRVTRHLNRLVGLESRWPPGTDRDSGVDGLRRDRHELNRLLLEKAA